MLSAAFAGARREMDDRALFAAFLAHPLQALRVLAGIHWEALKLWRKGLRIRPRPAPPAEAVSIGPGRPETGRDDEFDNQDAGGDARGVGAGPGRVARPCRCAASWRACRAAAWR